MKDSGVGREGGWEALRFFTETKECLYSVLETSRQWIIPMELKHKNALVCGSSDGIGKATAIELAKAGANVTLVARNEAKLKSVLAELESGTDQQHGYLVADFMDPAGLQQVVSKRLESLARFISWSTTPVGRRRARSLTPTSTRLTPR